MGDLYGDWNVQLTCGWGWTKVAEQHQMFSAEQSPPPSDGCSDISLCALEMTAVKTDNQLNMQKQTCIRPDLATHTHNYKHTHTYTNPQSFDSSSSGFDGGGVLMWHVRCYLRLVSPVSFIWFFSLWADCLFDKCACYRPLPSSCFSFPLTFIAFIFFSLIFVVHPF